LGAAVVIKTSAGSLDLDYRMNLNLADADVGADPQ
jgi:hypothetical protein